MTEDKLSKLFKLEYAPQGVFIIFTKELFEKGSDIMQDVLKEVVRVNLDQMDKEAIQKAIKEKTTDPVLVAPAQPEPVNGQVLARTNDDRTQVLIKIEPPMGRGRKAEIKDVMEAIKSIGGEAFYLDLEKIETMLSSFRFRDFVPVGERRDGKFEITVSQDATEATISISPPFGGNPVSLKHIVEYLIDSGIKTGIKKDVLQKVITDEIYNESIVIAVGSLAVDGEDGSIEFFFDTKSDKPKPTISEEGEVDFRELNLFQTVKKGAPLAKKIPVKPGQPGKTVYGTEIIPKQGRDVPFPNGLNTQAAKDDPNLLVALIDGQPRMQNNRVNVVPILDIPGDVDFSTGNINFTGSVNIKGNVISGFTVKAMGDVYVGGCIEMATIECGGTLTVKAGIVGMENALIMCRGNVNAKFIDKATVYADGDITVDESIMYSQVSSSSSIVLAGKKGFIMGGVTRASKSLKCNQLGTPTQTPTLVEVGGSPSLRAELAKIETEIQSAEENTTMQSKSLESVERKRQSKSMDAQLSEEQKERVMIMSRERFALLSKLRAFKEKKEDLEEKLVRLNSSGLKVHVKKKVMPGAKICIKNASWTTKDALDFATFREYDGEIQFGPYEGGE